MTDKERIIILKEKGLTKSEAKEFIAGCKRGIKARKRGDICHWSDLKRELGLD